MKIIRDNQTGSIALVGEAYVGEFSGADKAGTDAAIAVFGPLVGVTNQQYVTAVQRAASRMAAVRTGTTPEAVAAAITPTLTASLVEAVKAIPSTGGATVDQIKAATESAVRGVFSSLAA